MKLFKNRISRKELIQTNLELEMERNYLRSENGRLMGCNTHIINKTVKTPIKLMSKIEWKPDNRIPDKAIEKMVLRGLEESLIQNMEFETKTDLINEGCVMTGSIWIIPGETKHNPPNTGSSVQDR